MSARVSSPRSGLVSAKMLCECGEWGGWGENRALSSGFEYVLRRQRFADATDEYSSAVVQAAWGRAAT